MNVFLNQKYIVLICKSNKNITFYFYVLSLIRFLVPGMLIMVTRFVKLIKYKDHSSYSTSAPLISWGKELIIELVEENKSSLDRETTDAPS